MSPVGPCSVMVEALESRRLFAVAPAGEPFRVDPGSNELHGSPAVSADDEGDFVVTWTAEREFGEIEVFARRYTAAGAPAGSAFQVNQTPTGVLASSPDAESHTRTDVAMDADGDFVAVWEKARQTPDIGPVFDVYGRRFGADGAALGNEFRVSSASFTRPFAAAGPAVASAPGGDFVVTWKGMTRLTDHVDVFARRYDAAGAPRGDEFQVDAFDNNTVRRGGDVAVGVDGRFVVTWNALTGDSFLVFARRYDPQGAALGTEFEVSSVGGHQGGDSVAMDAAGRFVVAFQASTGPEIRFRRFGADGAPLGLDSVVASAPAMNGASVSTAPDGRFAVAWSDGPSAARERVVARWYGSDAQARTGPVEVSPAGSAAGAPAAVAVDAAGESVIVWRGSETGQLPGPGIFGRRYVNDRRPTLGSLDDTPDPVLSGRPVTLTPAGLSDPGGGAIDSVAFYRESNGVAGLQVPAGGAGGDTFLGRASAAPFTFAADTFGLAAGAYTYYAVARDAAGETSDPVSTANTVFAGPPGPPAVAQVYLGSSRWTPAFRQALRDAGLGGTEYGYAVPGGAAQLAPVPFGPIDRVTIRFTEDVAIPSGAFDLVGNDGRSYVAEAAAGFTYDPAQFVATWSLARPITADRVRLSLSSGAPGGVADFSRTALDGEWADGTDTFPSGNGTAGGDFNLTVNVLQGDVNRDGRVGAADYLEARRRVNRTPVPNPARYSVFADVDGSGPGRGIDWLDVFLVRNRLGRRLPAMLA